MNSRLKPMKTQLPIPPPKTGWHMVPDWHGNRFDHDRYWVKFKEKICLWELRGNLNKLPIQTLLMLNSDKTNQIPAPGPLLGWKRPEKTLQDALAEVGGPPWLVIEGWKEKEKEKAKAKPKQASPTSMLKKIFRAVSFLRNHS